MKGWQKIGLLVPGLAGMAVGGLWCISAVFFRIDGESEFHWVLVDDWCIGIPLAMGIFLTFLACRRHDVATKRPVIAVAVVAGGVWIGVAIAFTVWHCLQIVSRGGPDVLLKWLKDFWP